MRISVNLATRPFVELRPFFLRLRILMGVLLAVGLLAIIVAHVLQKKLDIAAGQLNQVHEKVVAVQQEKQGNERRMREPANAAVLARAHFLNALFLRKSFSWTAVMMDLETVLPAGVQVTSIEPEISADGDVIIRLRVSGDRDRAVQLVRNLERSKRFLAPRLTGESVQAKEPGSQGNNNANNSSIAPPGVEFEILADYNPLPEGEMYPKDKLPKDRTAAEVTTAVPSRKHLSGARRRAGNDGIVLKPYGTSHPRQAVGGPR
ncbi:MAG: PilN domain-containing protein [Acidobacteria bacterium]|nr:PilN domain-containing protein [Acidobacteriota bacterium]